MCPGALHPGALSISNRIKSFNIIKGRVSPIWITLFLHAFAHYICPDHLKTHRITLGSRTDHASDHASDQVLCFLSKATADHIPGSLLYANGVNGADLATLTEDIPCEGIPCDSLCCPQNFASEGPYSWLLALCQRRQWRRSGYFDGGDSREGIPYDSLCCPQSFASEALWSRL